MSETSPRNVEAEQATLGAVLLSDAALGGLLEEGLRPEHFAHEGHRAIYAAMLTLRDEGAGIDALMLEDRLRRSKRLTRAGGRAAIDVLASGTPNVANFREYGKAVIRSAVERKRRMAVQRFLDGDAGDDAWAALRAEVEGATNGHGPPEAEVAAIRRALFDDAQDTRDATGEAREEVPGTGGLLHRGVAALFFSERGHGKSTVALMIGMAAAAAGERVLYLDRENGAGLTKERVDGILDAHEGWGDPLAAGNFTGKHYPQLRSDWRGEAFGEAVAGAGFTVVVFDSAREMLTQLGGDPNSDRDVSAFFELAVTPLRRRGVAVVLLDNVGHLETHRPKGAGAKLDATPQAYHVITTSKFSATETGRVALACTRSRYGDDGREWSMRVGGGVWELPAATTEAPDAKRARQAREGRERFRLACVAALRERSALGRDPLITAARKRDASGKNKTLRGWLADLAADPTSGIVSDEREGYRLADDPLAPGGGATPGPAPPGTPWPLAPRP